MSNSQISLCGTPYPLSPGTEYVIRNKWIDLALVIGTLAFLTMATLASIGQFNTMSASQAASLSYGMSAGTALFGTLFLTKLISRYLIVPGDGKKLASTDQNNKKAPKIRKANDFHINTLRGFPVQSTFNTVVKSLKIAFENADEYECIIHWNFQKLLHPTHQILTPHEVYALIQGLDSDKCMYETITSADKHFKDLEDSFPGRKITHPELTAEKVYKKYFSWHSVLHYPESQDDSNW